MATTAWMLRQDGKSFPVRVHLYCMEDPDLSSEAECASFIVNTKSKDQDIAYEVLDAWMAMLIEQEVAYDADADDIDTSIREALSSLGYSFPYKLSIDEYIKIHRKLNNYYDVDTLYDYVDNCRDNLSQFQSSIRDSINQQFCRVRYGGEYNTESSNNSIWFRISSVGYNWANTIYEFTASMLNRLHIATITICRDYESDSGGMSGGSEYFYKAKDGAVYKDMPIDEYLAEEHEHSVVFSTSFNLNRGVYASVRMLLNSGNTFREIDNLVKITSVSNIYASLYRSELNNCIYCSQYFDDAPTRTRTKLGRVMRKIQQRFPEITGVDVDGEVRENNAGNPVGISYTFILESEDPKINGLEVRLGYTKSSVTEDVIFRDFRLEYLTWKNSVYFRR